MFRGRGSDVTEVHFLCQPEHDEPTVSCRIIRFGDNCCHHQQPHNANTLQPRNVLPWQIWGEIRYQAERALHNGWLAWPAWGKSTPSLWSPWAEAGVVSSPCLHFPLSSTTPILWPGGPGVFGSSPLRSFLFVQLANDLQRISFGLSGRCLCCSVSYTQGCWRVGPGAGLSCPGLRWPSGPTANNESPFANSVTFAWNAY